MRTVLALLVTACLVVSSGGVAQPSDDALAQALSTQPGVAITQGGEGETAYTEWRKEGVFFRRERHGSKEQWIGDDESGHGAVICSWMIFVTLRAALNECPADRFVDLRADLDQGVTAMEAFIVANSVLPTTVAELRAKAAAEAARTRNAVPSSGPRACPTGDVGNMIAAFEDMGRPARREMVDKLLSVPRWPVSNPCL